ncbi:MAG: DNA-binding protein [Proteobacteria bacterium]|nr:MAG: DNA-binding protein [Pseudomonadota bacterium]
MIMRMGSLSVAQAARRLGVSVSRIHQRISDGSLIAERIGSQWVIDERSLLHVQERSKPGRPFSAKSAWEIIALSEIDEDRERPSQAPANSRASKQLGRLLGMAVESPKGEEDVSALASSLRAMFRNRAERRQFEAASADLADLRADPRWAARVDLGASGIASSDVEGYLEESEVGGVVKDYLLVESDRAANVVLHVIVDGQNPFSQSRLRLAADLAEHRGPREEGRAAELVHKLAQQWKAGER